MVLPFRAVALTAGLQRCCNQFRLRAGQTPHEPAAPPRVFPALAAAAALSSITATGVNMFRPEGSCVCEESEQSEGNFYNLNDVGLDDKATLVRAVRRGDEELALILLRKLYGTVDAALTNNGETALHLACSAGQLNLARTLLKLRASPEKADASGATCIAVAAVGGHAAIIEELVTEYNADTSQLDLEGFAPLHRVVLGRHASGVYALLEYGADASIATGNSSRETPLHLLCRSRALQQSEFAERRAEMLSRILLHGANIVKGDAEGDSALHVCARDGDLAGLWALLSSTDEPWRALKVTNKKGVSALAEADEWGLDASFTVRVVSISLPLRRFCNEYWIELTFALNILVSVLFILGLRRAHQMSNQTINAISTRGRVGHHGGST